MRWSFQSCSSYFFRKLQSESITSRGLGGEGTGSRPGRAGPALSLVSGRSCPAPRRSRPRPGPGPPRVAAAAQAAGGAGRRGKMAAGIREKQTGERPSARGPAAPAAPAPAPPALGRGSGAGRSLPRCLCPRGPGCGRLRRGSRPLTRLGSPGNGVPAPSPPSSLPCGGRPGAGGGAGAAGPGLLEGPGPPGRGYVAVVPPR